MSAEELSTVATDTRQFIKDQGYTTTRTTVYTPGEHPNASSMNAILFLFELFGMISLLLSCILVINLITSVIKKQAKQSSSFLQRYQLNNRYILNEEEIGIDVIIHLNGVYLHPI